LARNKPLQQDVPRSLLMNVVGSLIAALLLTGGSVIIHYAIVHNRHRPAASPLTPTTLPHPSSSTVTASIPPPVTHITTPQINASGTVLASYTITIPDRYTVPLGPTAPTQRELSSTGVGDLTYYTSAGEASLNPTSRSVLYALPSGANPTYPSCISDLNRQTASGTGAGTSFCLSLPDEKLMDGVTVSYISTSEINPTYVMIQVTVWKN
jgi:hypothetical protein